MHEKPSPLSMRSFVYLSDFSYLILLKYFILFNFLSCLAALECSLLAMALTRKDRNWHANYKEFSGGCTALSPQMNIASNHIPAKHRPYLLLEDFFQLSDFDCEIDLSVFDVRKNVSFLLLLFMHFLRILVRSVHV